MRFLVCCIHLQPLKSPAWKLARRLGVRFPNRAGVPCSERVSLPTAALFSALGNNACAHEFWWVPAAAAWAKDYYEWKCAFLERARINSLFWNCRGNWWNMHSARFLFPNKQRRRACNYVSEHAPCRCVLRLWQYGNKNNKKRRMPPRRVNERTEKWGFG
jgi:hypothetical protein